MRRMEWEGTEWIGTNGNCLISNRISLLLQHFSYMHMALQPLNENALGEMSYANNYRTLYCLRTDSTRHCTASDDVIRIVRLGGTA